MKFVSLLLLFVSLNAFSSQDNQILEAAEKKAVAFYKLESTQKAFSYTAVSDDMIDSGCYFSSEMIITCMVTDSLPIDAWSHGLAIQYSLKDGPEVLSMVGIEKKVH
jgi:hypothetical protein